MFKAMLKHKLWLAMGVMIGATAAITGQVMAEKQAGAQPIIPVEELRAFVSVYDRIKQTYVEDTEDSEIIQKAIEGMVSSLDPHSAYLPPKDFKDMQVSTHGEFGGLGIEVTMEDGFVKVVTPIDDTPAFEAGVKAGDMIIRLDGKTVKGMTLNDAVNVMRGKPKTDIELTIMRKGEDAPLKIVITRDIIKIRSVKARMLEPNYGYVRISQFQVPTGDQLVKKLKSLQEENGSELKGIVLDLRNNPGGVLTASVDVVDAFLDEAKVVYTEGRIPDSDEAFYAEDGDVLNGAPIVVLMNGGSASASEIVAGALQDHKRAVIVGQKSFGKGSVQTIMPLSNGAAIKLTTARYFTPNGRSIQAQGIEPDIVLEPVKVERIKQDDLMVKEKDLEGHLNNPAGEDDGKTKATPLIDEDYELYQALNTLKALSLSRR